MSNAELEALIEARYKVEQIAPGLLAWLDAACVWQLQRRNGYRFELPPPEAAIPPEEDAVSSGAAISSRDTFAKESPVVRAVVNARDDNATPLRPGNQQPTMLPGMAQ